MGWDLVWPVFCDGNFGKFYLKLYPYYKNLLKYQNPALLVMALVKGKYGHF